ncbi:PP2C family protein-serine/threonine phosphatase [Streptomyces sp. UNOC14_S4]|uniref:PP2C family protein-serine/threonine phosphatase n=1 Tax=Streptomyces sp. UNOC14_S4 TaxID=2872340 RepID=UPI001E3D7D1C|nr:PP2C family protein-serine/threonine phosphatase [Streptomyces sp. UNOC14_S4]MCC3771861.1 serine/threonine-protein phosphatase [Streptomyces sp. UNOC14_S4]
MGKAGKAGNQNGPQFSRGDDASSPRARHAARAVRYLPYVLVVGGGVVFDVLTPPDYTCGPFENAAPLVAAPFHSLSGTALVAAAAITATLILVLLERVNETGTAVSEMVTVLVVSLLALGINSIGRRSVLRLASARSIAETAQRAVLPVPPARIGGLRVAARYVAAQADARIGGDLYAVQDTPYGVRAIVGDVRGKGLEAVEAVAVVIGAFREAAEQERTLDALAERLERALQREGARRANLDQFEGFTTAVLAEMPQDAPVLRLVNRGHPAPLLLRPGGEVVEAVPAVPALPLGMGELEVSADRVSADQVPTGQVEELAFPSGTTLLLFTDGVTEARDADGDFYDPRARLTGRQFKNPEALLECLVDDVARHSGDRTADDMALLAIRRGDGRHHQGSYVRPHGL